MRFRTALCLAFILVFCFSVAAWSTPIPDRSAPARITTPPDNQSLSGKISAIKNAPFALEVTKVKNEFMINGDTKVESKLKAGSQAKAEHRFADGRNVAVHVVVTPTSEISAR